MRLNKATLALILTLLYLPFPSLYASSKETGFDQLFADQKAYIHGFANGTLSYTDNVFFTSTDPISDIVLQLNGGIGVIFPASASPTSTAQSAQAFLNTEDSGAIQAYLFYLPNMTFYSSQESQNSQNHVIEGVARFTSEGGLQTDLSYQDTYLIDTSTSNNVSDFNEYHSINNKLNISYLGIESIAISTDFLNTRVDYDDARNAFRNSDTFSNTITLSYVLDVFFTLAFDYSIDQIEYPLDTAKNAKQQTIRGGFTWRFLEGDSLNVQLGQDIRNFETSSQGPVSTSNISLDFLHELQQSTAVSVSYTRGIEETTDKNSTYMVQQNISGGVTHMFTSRIDGSITLDFSKNSYEGGTSQGQYDNSLGIGVHGRYILGERISSSIEYNYKTTSSSEANQTALQNVISFQVAMAF